MLDLEKCQMRRYSYEVLVESLICLRCHLKERENSFYNQVLRACLDEENTSPARPGTER